ncbi:MAG: YiiX/YebB-like N1pC/P60 family cysteine hydrolase [Hyphomicrobiaceae bacterium]
MTYVDSLLDRLSQWIACRLTEESSGYQPFTPSDPETLASVLEPCDVLLVEGNQHLSNAIKYLTQSTWSHAALYIGGALGETASPEPARCLVEANIGEGVIAAPLAKYATYNTRICRPVGLSEDEKQRVIGYAVARIGQMYDTRNILDLARYLMPIPPVPTRWRRRLLALGSGEPTRTICSTLIAQAFHEVRYPILPRVEKLGVKRKGLSEYSRWEIHHIRHHSLYAPRDFDLSPYFRVIKPNIETGFDHRTLTWSSAPPTEGPRGKGRVVEERPVKSAAAGSNGKEDPS